MFRSLPAVLVIACAAVACSPLGGGLHAPPGAATLPPLEQALGRLVSSRPVEVVASPNWVPAKEQPLWSFAHSAAFAVWVGTSPGEPLIVSLTMDRGDASTLRFRWDGDTVQDRWIRFEGDVIRLQVPTGRLTPGIHSLAVIRTTFDPNTTTKHTLAFRDISWALGAFEERIDPQNPYRQFRIARFLLDGVMASKTTEHLGGILFDGPGAAVLPAGDEAHTVLHAKLQNVSPQPATFTVRTGTTTVEKVVEPYATAPLTAPLGDGRALLLQVSGPADGLYLWGAPYVERGTASSLTPVILVTLDTTRRDAVPPWGGSRKLTPNLRDLARRATAFDRAVSTAPWTLPSHASMFTGLYPSHHLGGATLQALPSRVTTLAELLREHGYVTAGFAGGFFCSSRFGVSQGFMVYHEPEDWEIPGDRLTDLVLDFLDGMGNASPFLFVNLFDAHEPYRAPEPFRALSGAERMSSRRTFPRPWNRIVGGEPGTWVAAVTRDIPFPPAALRALRAEYDAEVSFDDFQLGRLIQALRARGLYDRSLFVVVADHGEFLGEHRLLDHGGRLDPELIEVPLLVKFPGQRTSRTVSELVSTLDLYPTVLETAGIRPPASDGISLVPENEQRLRSRAAVFSEEHEMGMHTPIGRLRIDRHVYGVDSLARRSFAWSAGEECFERWNDAWRAATCTAPGATMRLVEATLGGPDLLVGGAGVSLSASDMEKLKAIGYVH